MTQSKSPTALVSLLLALSYSAGCGIDAKPAAAPDGTGRGGASATDPDDVPMTEADVAIPTTFSEAVTRIATYRDQIHTAIDGGTPTEAHRPLDELDVVLKKLMPLVRDSGVPKPQWQKLNAATKTLQDSFNTLHAAIDRKEPPDFESVQEAITIAIGTLEKAANEAPGSQK